jgi:hypothetical protein
VGRFRRLATSPATSLALAASLLACLVGFPLWIATHDAAELPLPLAVAAPGAEVTRGETDRLLTVRAEAETSLLALPLPPNARFPSYRVEIRSPDGRLRLEAALAPAVVAAAPAQGPTSPPPPPPPGILTLVLPSHLLAPGEYRLRIVGVRDGRGEVLSESPLQVLGPAS